MQNTGTTPADEASAANPGKDDTGEGEEGEEGEEEDLVESRSSFILGRSCLSDEGYSGKCREASMDLLTY